MGVTDREQEIIDLLRREPLITPAEIAERLGSSRAAVNVHLSNLGRKGVILGRGYILSEKAPVVVVGGANLDIKARSSAAAIAHTSNPGHTTTTPGGVARNIAENLARLGTPTQLIAAIGRDPYGERLLADTRAAGVQLDHVHRGEQPTGSYTAVLDADGELVLAVADMTATDALRPEHLQSARELIAHAALLVLDGNLPAPTTAHLLDLAHAGDVRVVIDPVSVPKAARLAPLLRPERPIFALTPKPRRAAGADRRRGRRRERRGVGGRRRRPARSRRTPCVDQARRERQPTQHSHGRSGLWRRPRRGRAASVGRRTGRGPGRDRRRRRDARRLRLRASGRARSRRGGAPRPCRRRADLAEHAHRPA